MEKNNQGIMSEPEQYWNKAGELGYSEAMYSDGKVAARVNANMRSLLLSAANSLGLGAESSILELGCGDGDLANHFLSKYFKEIEGHDLSPAGVQRANQKKKSNTNFYCSDITALNFDKIKHWDGVFFVGILHHVKGAAEKIISQIIPVSDCIIVMEPNGNHLVRKLLEQFPSYKEAGEDSFRRAELEKIFESCGYKKKYYKRFNIFPNFTPSTVFSATEWLEPFIEKSKYLDFLCTNQVWAFEKTK